VQALGTRRGNPAAEIRSLDILKPTTKTNMARIDAKELPALLRAIELYDGRPLTRQAIKLIALTFVRTSELIARAGTNSTSMPGAGASLPSE